MVTRERGHRALNDWWTCPLPTQRGHDDFSDAMRRMHTFITGYGGTSDRVRRRNNLAHAMQMVGIGKAWRGKCLNARRENQAKFEAKFKRRAETDQQWAEAWRLFTVLQVTAALEKP